VASQVEVSGQGAWNEEAYGWVRCSIREAWVVVDTAVGEHPAILAMPVAQAKVQLSSSRNMGGPRGVVLFSDGSNRE
jgi:hypothetical protein